MFSQSSSFIKTSEIFSLLYHPFIKFLESFFLGSQNPFLMIFKNCSSFVSQKSLCFSKSKTDDSNFGAGTKHSFGTLITSET
jgi:hypothetical protein